MIKGDSGHEGHLMLRLCCFIWVSKYCLMQEWHKECSVQGIISNEETYEKHIEQSACLLSS